MKKSDSGPRYKVLHIFQNFSLSLALFVISWAGLKSKDSDDEIKTKLKSIKEQLHAISARDAQGGSASLTC